MTVTVSNSNNNSILNNINTSFILFDAEIKEKNSYLCSIINEFANYEAPNDDNIKESNNPQILNKNSNKINISNK